MQDAENIPRPVFAGKDRKMLLIGICGASGSGKSTLAAFLQERIGKDRCTVLLQDAYYRDQSFLPFEERKLINYDAPGIFDHDLLLHDVDELMLGHPVTMKGYNYSEHRREDPPGIMITPKEVLILEGIHCFYDPRLTEKMSLKLYVEVDQDICLLRRIKRDIQERGRDIEGISRQYMDGVRPMYQQYVRHYVRDADMIIPGTISTDRAAKVLIAYIENTLQK